MKEGREELGSTQSIATQGEMLTQLNTSEGHLSHAVDEFDSNSNHMSKTGDDEEYEIDRWEPKPPKVLMENSNDVPLELRSQIQMYATTE